MKKIVLVLCVFMLLTGCSSGENKDINTQSDAIVMSDSMIANNTTEASGYQEIYGEYISANPGYFDNGMVLCDLDEDGTPELFSIMAGQGDGSLLQHHRMADGKVFEPDNSQNMISILSLECGQNHFLDPTMFTGLYRHKQTGQKAIISAVPPLENYFTFNIITYNGEALEVDDNGFDTSEAIDANANTDTIMADYELCDENLYFRLFFGESCTDAVGVFNELAEEFESFDGIEYAEAEDGELECYIRNIDLNKKEMDVIPVAKISYEEFNKVVNSDGIYKVNEDELNFIYEKEFAENTGAYLVTKENSGWQSYPEVPTEVGSYSVIDKYYGNAPVKLKISNDLKINYPSFYEGTRKAEYTIDEYLPHYAEYKFTSHYIATVKDSEITELDVLYHP